MCRPLWRIDVWLFFMIYYHVSTILMRVALGTISKFHIYFYILYDIIFTLREMREMFKFVKVVASKANEVVYGEVY